VHWKPTAEETQTGDNDDDNILAQWITILSQSFLQHELSALDIQDIAAHCIHRLVSSSGDFTFNLADDGNNDDAHDGCDENIKEDIGYTLADACKVFYTHNAMQCNVVHYLI
jgi:hypothetical protein